MYTVYILYLYLYTNLWEGGVGILRWRLNKDISVQSAKAKLILRPRIVYSLGRILRSVTSIYNAPYIYMLFTTSKTSWSRIHSFHKCLKDIYWPITSLFVSIATMCTYIGTYFQVLALVNVW